MNELLPDSLLLLYNCQKAHSHQIFWLPTVWSDCEKMGAAPIASNSLKPVRSDSREQIYLKIIWCEWSKKSLRDTCSVLYDASWYVRSTQLKYFWSYLPDLVLSALANVTVSCPVFVSTRGTSRIRSASEWIDFTYLLKMYAKYSLHLNKTSDERTKIYGCYSKTILSIVSTWMSTIFLPKRVTWLLETIAIDRIYLHLYHKLV